jgi:5-methylcytosine-specific restriction enzyme subunit McrC
MQTDIVLASRSRKIVLDTKYYPRALQTHFNREKVRSDHLYQILTYVANAGENVPGQTVEGMLLYPTVDMDFCLKYLLQGHPVTVRTINLAQDWRGIDRDLRLLLA